MDKSRAAILSAAAGNTHTQTHKRSRLKTHNPGCDVGLFSSPRKENNRNKKKKTGHATRERESGSAISAKGSISIGTANVVPVKRKKGLIAENTKSRAQASHWLVVSPLGAGQHTHTHTHTRARPTRISDCVLYSHTHTHCPPRKSVSSEMCAILFLWHKTTTMAK